MIIISEIRNEIAHSHVLKVFDNKNIVKKCDKLTYWRIFQSNLLRKLFDSNFKKSLRNKYIFTILIISQLLLLKIKVMRKEIIKINNI